MPGGKPSDPLVVAPAAVAVLVEPDRHLDRPQFHAHRLDHHLGGVFPGLRPDVHVLERCQGDPAHAAVDIGELGAVDQVKQEGGQRGAEIAVQGRHGTGLHRTPEARSHDVFIAFAEAFKERCDLAEVIGAIGVAHDHVTAPDDAQSVLIGPAQSPGGRLEDARALVERDLRGAVGGAVDDQDLGSGAGLFDAFHAPVDEFADHRFLVHRRDDDRNFGFGNIVGRNKELSLGVGHRNPFVEDRVLKYLSDFSRPGGVMQKREPFSAFVAPRCNGQPLPLA